MVLLTKIKYMKDKKIRKGKETKIRKGKEAKPKNNFFEKHRLKVAYSSGFLATILVLSLIEPRDFLWYSIQAIIFFIVLIGVGIFEKKDNIKNNYDEEI